MIVYSVVFRHLIVVNPVGQVDFPRIIAVAVIVEVNATGRHRAPVLLSVLVDASTIIVQAAASVQTSFFLGLPLVHSTVNDTVNDLVYIIC